jgi:hypothetical protein
MIPAIEINIFVTLLIFIMLLIVLGLWIRYTFFRKLFSYSLGKPFNQCRFCGVVYVVRNEKSISKCPRCKSFGETIK